MVTRLAGTNLHCPSCSTILDGASYPGDHTAMPESGDKTICAYCAAVLEFTLESGKGFGYRELSDEEMAELPIQQQQQIELVKQAIAEFNSRRTPE